MYYEVGRMIVVGFNRDSRASYTYAIYALINE